MEATAEYKDDGRDGRTDGGKQLDSFNKERIPVIGKRQESKANVDYEKNRHAEESNPFSFRCNLLVGTVANNTQ